MLNMRKNRFPSFFFIAIFVIMLLPKLAGFLPLIFFSWFLFRILFSSSSRSPKRPRENPYRKRYEKKYGQQYEHKHADSRHKEPESYRPKNYRYNDEYEAEASQETRRDDLKNPWQKKTNTPKASYGQKDKKQTAQKPKTKYKAASISKQEKQSFIIYFIPVLVGALAASVAMQMGNTSLEASIIGIFLALSLLGIMLLIRGKRQKKALSGNELIFEQGSIYVNQITEIAERVGHNPSIQWEIQEIAHIVEALYENFREDPSDIDRARSFIKYNLPEAVKLMDSYAKISSRSEITSAPHTAQLQKAEEAIIAIRESFGKLQQNLLTNDLMDLEIQSRTIKGVLQNNLHFIKE